MFRGEKMLIFARNIEQKIYLVQQNSEIRFVEPNELLSVGVPISLHIAMKSLKNPYSSSDIKVLHISLTIITTNELFIIVPFG